MGYGGFVVGPGASRYDLDQLIVGIINGQVCTPIATWNGVCIATDEGEAIAMCYSREEELKNIQAAFDRAIQALSGTVEEYREQSETRFDQLSGTVEQYREQSETRFDQLSGTVEEYRARYVEDIHALVAGIFAGEVVVPLEDFAGTAIGTDEGDGIAARSEQGALLGVPGLKAEQEKIITEVGTLSAQSEVALAVVENS